MNSLDFYKRKDIQDELLRVAKDREFAARYGESFGKRPDILQFKNDLLEYIKSGATSFHISEERFKDPLMLKPGMKKEDLDNLRSGWDLIIDIDGENFEDCRIVAKYLIDALKYNGIKNISVKFSGNKGFHIGVPFEAFPDSVNNIEIKNLFPDGIRVIAVYLKGLIKEHLEKKLGKDPFSKADIDSVLISSRHMFRAPYSLHEKSGLVSLPINPDRIMEFNKEEAKPENVKTIIKFLDKAERNEARRLLIQAFDSINKPKEEVVKKEYAPINIKVAEELFPPCIKIGLRGLDDGKKRFIFILINFLRSLGWDINEIEASLLEWNKRNKEPLKENYILSQVSWSKRQKTIMLPGNCDNPAYYKGIGICVPDNLCRLVKNPVNYSKRKLNINSKD